MRVRTSFVAQSSRIDERGRGEDEEHKEHDERTQERTQRGITREAYEGIAKPKSTTRSMEPVHLHGRSTVPTEAQGLVEEGWMNPN